MLRLTSLALAAVVLAASTATGSQGAAARSGTTVKTVSSQFGTILGDRKGQAFYIFGKERTSRSDCYGACAKAWPPVLASGRPAAAKGVRASFIGTTRRRDGTRQLTFRGRPLYYYVSDAPGRILCHDVREFGGLWQVIRPDGVPVA
jgi:predicted lipoprotein with Yx(FWY)xxD motif